MIGSAYATFDEYRSAKGGVSGADQTTIERELKSWSRAIERDLGQFFNKDAAVVNRVFLGSGTNCLRLDRGFDLCPGIATSTGVVITIDTDDDGSFADETAWATTDYELRPVNALLGPEAVPYREIIATSWGSQGVFPYGQRVQVTAKFGWPAVPTLIKDLLMEMVAIWRLDSNRATDRMNELDQVVSTSPIAKGLLNRARDAYWMPVLA